MSDCRITTGDCRDVMAEMEPASVEAVVTDPPYGLEFMGKGWDHGVPGAFVWTQVSRVLKPGGHLLAFGGTRTFHRLTCAIEDAGFEIRDCLMWLYGTGFPKSLNVSKGIDKHGGARVGWFGPWLRKERERRGLTQKALAQHFPSKTGGLTGCVANWELGLNMPRPEQFNLLCEVLGLSFARLEEAERDVVGQRSTGIGTGGGSTPVIGDGNRDVTVPATPDAKRWAGWGTALKPAWEPIVLARKPLTGTVAQNVLEHGCGALNVDGCRVESGGTHPHASGRWPANLVLDEAAAGMLDEQAGVRTSGKAPDAGFVRHSDKHRATYAAFAGNREEPTVLYGDSGGAPRFFYTAKASTAERDGATHPTVKPVALMRWLVRLVTPPGGTVLDPFMGSGSTAIACHHEGFGFLGIELSPEYVAMAERRIGEAMRQGRLSFGAQAHTAPASTP